MHYVNFQDHGCEARVGRISQKGDQPEHWFGELVLDSGKRVAYVDLELIRPSEIGAVRRVVNELLAEAESAGYSFDAVPAESLKPRDYSRLDL